MPSPSIYLPSVKTQKIERKKVRWCHKAKINQKIKEHKWERENRVINKEDISVVLLRSLM